MCILGKLGTQATGRDNATDVFALQVGTGTDGPLGFIASTVWLAKGVHCSVCLCIARVRKCFVLYVLLIFSDKKSPVLSGAGWFGC